MTYNSQEWAIRPHSPFRMVCPVAKDDILFVTTDGVHDNLAAGELYISSACTRADFVCAT